MSEARDIACNMVQRAGGKPAFASMDEARRWVQAQWPDWKDWIGIQMLDNITEAIMAYKEAN